MTPLISTLADLTAAKISQFAKDNMPKPPQFTVTQGSVDPTVYRSDDYIRGLNLNSVIATVYGWQDVYGGMYGVNRTLADRFDFLCKGWEQGSPANGVVFSGPKDPNKIPGISLPWPAYEAVDVAAFTQLWNSQESIGGCIVPAPALLPIALLPDPVTAAAPAPDNPVGDRIAGTPNLYHFLGGNYNVFDDDPSKQYMLINMNPVLNFTPQQKPDAFAWLKK